MRASNVVPSFAIALAAAMLSLACSDDSSSPSGDDGASGGGSGGSATGGSTNGGTSSGGTPTGGSDAGGASSGTGGSNAGGSATGGGEPGGTGSGGDAGMPGTGGTSNAGSGGASSGGGGDAGASGGLGGTPSVGCNSARVPMSGRFTIDVDGTEREYILKLPAGYDVTMPRAYRLVLLFHGRAYSAQTVADGGAPGMTGPYYGLEAASAGDAILVAAQALSTSWTNASGRDVAYIDAMIERFEAELCVDESRIFAVGFSMGAIMTLTAACEPASLFRAIAPMSASLPSNCSGGEPVAYWASHGTNDTTITPSQGEAVRDSFIAKNGCDTTTMPGDRAGCVNYQGCDAGKPVTWCTFTGVHEPPPYAGAAIWAFFSQF